MVFWTPWSGTSNVSRPPRPRKIHPSSTRTRRLKAPKSPSPETRRRMQGTRRTGTGCELSVRAALRGHGLRFRVDWPIVGTRRRADIAFIGSKVAVFVDGCFWHACPNHATWPKTNSAWWRAKIEGNVLRDRSTDAHLRAAGWIVLRFWEHADATRAASRIVSVVSQRRVGRRKP